MRALGQFNVDGKPCVITRVDARDISGEWGAWFELSAAGVKVQADSSARWLSASALAGGAQEVRWDFDLKLAEDLP